MDVWGTYPWLGNVYWGNTVQDYLIALGILLGFLVFLKFLKRRIFGLLRKWSQRTKTDIDDEFVKNLESIPGLLYFVAGLFLSFQIITVHHLASKTVEVIFIILLIHWTSKLASELIRFSLQKLAVKKGFKRDEKDTTYVAFTLVVRLVLWSVGFLLILSNLGVNISALIASLGIGGIAVALAVQNILGDMFSSFSIYLDKPFEIGDFIVVGEHSGTVKKVGLKSTRIEALQGEEIVISNKELTTIRVQNYKRMQKRRIAFHLLVSYDTPPKKLAKIPTLIESIIRKIKLTEFSRAHFWQFGDTGLQFEVVYFIDSSDYLQYMDIQQQINLELLKIFEKEKIELAMRPFPKLV